MRGVRRNERGLLAFGEKEVNIALGGSSILMKRHLLGIVVGLFALVAGGIGYSYGAYYGGKIEAHLDLVRGQYNIRVYGLPNIGIVEYKEILSKEYGVELVAVADCIVSREIQEEARGYNEVSEAAIEKRHGTGVLESVWQRAQAEYQSKQNIGGRE